MIAFFRTRHTFTRVLALTSAFSLLLTLLPVGFANASNSGPHQPEFTGFEPVSTHDMVNTFTGDFTYNLPLLEVPGPNGLSYPINLAYHSGLSPDQEASWVGLGWTLNPGAVNRNVKGFPDDLKNETVTYHDKMEPMEIMSWTVDGNIEAVALDKDADEPTNFALSAGVGYTQVWNSYTGINHIPTASLGIMNSLSGTMTFDEENGTTFLISFNPISLALKLASLGKKNAETDTEAEETEKTRFDVGELVKRLKSGLASNYPGSRGFYSGVLDLRPTHFPQFETATGGGMKLNIQGNPVSAPIGLQGGVSFSRSVRTSDETVDRQVYGYLYHEDAKDPADKQDYMVERDEPFNKNDHYLGIPFNGADQYSVTGHGLGGTFRLQHRKASIFRPNEVKGVVNVDVDGGLEVAIGKDIGIGLDLTVSAEDFRIGDLKHPTNYPYGYDPSAPADPGSILRGNAYFRMDGDKAVSPSHGTYSEPQSARFKSVSGAAGTKRFDAHWPDAVSPIASDPARKGNEALARSTNISFTTNKEMMETETHPTTGQLVYYNAFEKRDDALSGLVDRSDPAIADQVGEIAFAQPSGTRYVYGLPVYQRNQQQMQYSLDGKEAEIRGDNVRMTAFDPDGTTRRIGESLATPFANTYLLTQITAPDYVDLTMDGTTDDDPGGFVKFDYTQAYGFRVKSQPGGLWRPYRIPHTGLNYHPNKISDPRDDMGGVESGEKEVYYLNRIDTKTHYAVFHRSVRHDGIAPNPDESQAATVTDAQSQTFTSTARAQKLDRIALWVKDIGGQPKLLKEILFEYDYSLQAGQPNSEFHATENPDNGKLTLTKVRVRYPNYRDDQDEKVYTFDYNYMNPSDFSLSPADQSKYADVIALPDGVTATNQNPDFGYCITDPWGSYKPESSCGISGGYHDPVGQDRSQLDFDPAAWHLKQVGLPGGGKVLVQYEQNSYEFVQDMDAMQLLPLESGDPDGRVFELDLSPLGIDGTDMSEVTALRDRIHAYFLGSEAVRSHIYFKFLYELKDIPNLSPDVDNCMSEYIDGYTPVEAVEVVGNPGSYTVQITFREESGDRFTYPHSVCKRFAKVVNRFVARDCDDESLEDFAPSLEVPGEKREMENLFFKAIKIGIPGPLNCPNLNHAKSYLRIPTTQSKIGGGVRVKRLLRYDAGRDQLTPTSTGTVGHLYGTEYLYEEAGRSFGVATNEPPKLRAESPLVYPLPRDDERWDGRVYVGRDRKETEGPIGEALLPGASIGYSRVVSKGIHEGKTGTGFVEHLYHTVKDYPLQWAATEIEEKSDVLNLNLILASADVRNFWVSQGYKFDLYEMHGQPNQTTRYAGIYGQPDTYQQASSTKYNYDLDGGQTLLLPGDCSVTADLGTNTEITAEQKYLRNNRNSGSGEGGFDIGIETPILIPYAYGMGSYGRNENEIQTHVLNSVTRHLPILSSVETENGGKSAMTEHISFDGMTGEPVISRSKGNFDAASQLAGGDGWIYTQNLPTSHVYPEYGRVSTNERLYMDSEPDVEYAEEALYLVVADGTLWVYAGGPEATWYADGLFQRGDLIQVTKGTEDRFYVIDEEVTNEAYRNRVRKYSVRLADFEPEGQVIWHDVEIRVLQSGKRNQISEACGVVRTIHDAPAAEYLTSPQAVTDLANALNAGLPSLLSTSNPTFMVSLSGIASGLQSSWDYQSTDGHVCPSVPFTSLYPTATDVMVWVDQNTTPSDGQALRIGLSENGVTRFDIPQNLDNLPLVGGMVPAGTALGTFAAESNNLVYYTAAGRRTLIQRFSSCTQDREMDKVLSMAATTYKPQPDFSVWEENKNVVTAPHIKDNDGLFRRWRVDDEHVYQKVEYVTPNPNFATGATDNVRLYEYAYPDGNDPAHWRFASRITKSDHQGQNVESVNPLDIYTGTAMDRAGRYVRIQANNAQIDELIFVDFEMEAVQGEDYRFGMGSLIPDPSQAHSGQWSARLDIAADPARAWTTFADVFGYRGIKKGHLRLWVNALYFEDDPAAQFRITYQNGLALPFDAGFTELKRVGKWRLLEAELLSNFGHMDNLELQVRPNASGTAVAWFDDIRIEPKQAVGACYVYDLSNGRLMTTFDDQHFGTYFQYDAEGKLISKRRETEAGFITVEEMHHHLRQESSDD